MKPITREKSKRRLALYVIIYYIKNGVELIMRLGILALVLIFFASGSRYIRESGILLRRRGGSRDETRASAEAALPSDAEQAVYDRRKLAFGCLMLLVGALVLVYYFATL